MWSKKPTPVSILIGPVASRSTAQTMRVSLVSRTACPTLCGRVLAGASPSAVSSRSLISALIETGNLSRSRSPILGRSAATPYFVSSARVASMSDGRAIRIGPTPLSTTMARLISRTRRSRSRRTEAIRSAVSIIRDGSSACIASRTRGSGRA